MSSVGSECSVGGGNGRLVVHVAENGHSCEVDCREGMTVAEVQSCLEKFSGIPSNFQLLLCGDTKLEPNRTLAHYKLPCDGRDLFLYNRARLVADSSSPVIEEIELPEPVEPPSPSSSQDPHPLDDALDPALKALPSYERQFRYHFQKGHAIYGTTQMKYEMCRRFLREQRVQESALEAARGNMDHSNQIISQMYMDFMKYFSQQHRYHSDLLVNLKKDIDKLKSCKIHPRLQSESRKCLLDFVKEENLYKLSENCASSHRQFEAKVLQLKAIYTELKGRVDGLLGNGSSVSLMDVERMIKEHQHYLDQQTSIMQSLSKDVDTVKKLVDDCVSSVQLSASIRPHDAVSALGPMYDVHHKNHMPKMQACDRAISKLLEICKAKKNEMNLVVHTIMQKIASVQSSIREIRMQLPAFKEAMARQDDIFADLKLVRRIGPAYRACLAEVVRRKASMKLYMGLAGQLAEKLALKRDAEIERRDEFLKAHSPYIPRDVLALMGLFEYPSQCDVNIVPFDLNLLNIDIADVDRYAPESAFGFFIKSGRGSFSTSSSQTIQGGEISADAPQKYEHEDGLEDCEAIEIAGTSKLEVENAWLKAELASAKALICSYGAWVDHESLDDTSIEELLKANAEKTVEALHLKDEFCKHLQDSLKSKDMQNMSYEKRIKELEQILSEQCQANSAPGAKNSIDSGLSSLKNDNFGSLLSGNEEEHAQFVPSEPMDEASSSSVSLDVKVDGFTGQILKHKEGMDENMADLLALPKVPTSDPSLDTSMLDTRRDELSLEEKETKQNLAQNPEQMIEIGHVDVAKSLELTIQEAGVNHGSDPDSSLKDNLISELQLALADKSSKCDEAESQLHSAVDEVTSLRRELEHMRTLLDETQMNCAHLENCLHEAREEAHTNLCAADRRASEYSALRTSAVKLRGLFERLRSCVSTSGAVDNFADSLRSLALSLGSEDDVNMEFRACIRSLADKVAYLSRHRAELLERCSRAEAAEKQLNKDLDLRSDLVKNLYAKVRLEKQVNKEKISFGRLEVHELAAFILNPGGCYEAINRSCSTYYLSPESVALFVDNVLKKPIYIIGQIVHIERKVVKMAVPVRDEAILVDQREQVGSSSMSSSISKSEAAALVPRVSTSTSNNPYGLPAGSEYFVVTVAMLPDISHP